MGLGPPENLRPCCWNFFTPIRTAGPELRVCIGVKKFQQHGRKFSGGPSPDSISCRGLSVGRLSIFTLR